VARAEEAHRLRVAASQSGSGGELLLHEVERLELERCQLVTKVKRVAEEGAGRLEGLRGDMKRRARGLEGSIDTVLVEVEEVRKLLGVYEARATSSEGRVRVLEEEGAAMRDKLSELGVSFAGQNAQTGIRAVLFAQNGKDVDDDEPVITDAKQAWQVRVKGVGCRM
jgi:hypothetical protein